jgi:hypothetical protein
MDQFERQDILDEFFIKWKVGTTPRFVEEDLLKRGLNPSDVKACRKLFEKWIDTKFEFVCPVCKETYHLAHLSPGHHKFEPVEVRKKA